MLRQAIYFAATLIVAALGASSAAEAQVLAALAQSGDKLYLLTDNGGISVAKTVKIKIKSGDPILAIDARPSNGRLYGVSKKGAVYMIDTSDGAIFKQFAIDAKLKGVVSMDCDGVSDTCRVATDKGLNGHIDFKKKKFVDDKAFSYAKGKKSPEVIGLGYTATGLGDEGAVLFVLDAATNQLMVEKGKKPGVLDVVGEVKEKFDVPIAFDVLNSGAGFFIRGGKIYQLDLGTAETRARKVKGLDAKVRDAAFVDF